MKDPWDRRASETPVAFHGFQHYRDLGAERSVDRAYKQHVKWCQGGDRGDRRACRRWLEWSRQHGWVERSTAFDIDTDRRRLLKNERGIGMMNERMMAISLRMQEVVLDAMDEIDPAALNPFAMAKWLEVAQKLESSARGVGPQMTVKHVFQEAEALAKELGLPLETVVADAERMLSAPLRPRE